MIITDLETFVNDKDREVKLEGTNKSEFFDDIIRHKNFLNYTLNIEEILPIHIKRYGEDMDYRTDKRILIPGDLGYNNLVSECYFDVEFIAKFNAPDGSLVYEFLVGGVTFFYGKKTPEYIRIKDLIGFNLNEVGMNYYKKF